tara:strand:+ start:596 stop:1222 length:627 start_codon:yes stop_codon:yes gene_type:complete
VSTLDFGKDVLRNQPRDISNFDTYFEYLLSRGFSFFIFDEEPEYAEAYSSFPNNTARYHFIEMITQGGHSFNHPMSDAEVKLAHPDLNEKEIQNLRRVYKLNYSLRPFKIPVQISRSGLGDEDIATINANLSAFETKVRQSSSLIINEPKKPKFNSIQKLPSIRGTIVSRASVSPPSNPNVGDLWYNSGTAKLFSYLSDGKSTYWVEV